MDQQKLQDILGLTIAFAASNNEVLAVGLCGSWARGTPNPDSDVDLTILVEDKLSFKKTDWLEELDFNQIDENIESFKDKSYGLVWSRHVFLQSNTEIEFSFADRSWADIENLDEGTRKVVSDGYKILYDPKLILKKLVEKVREKNST